VAEATHGLGGLKYDPAKRTRAPEWNVFGALVLIVVIFEILNRLQGGSFLFNMRDNVDAIFNQQRLDIMILQVAIIGIIALGVTQVIIIGGIDLSSGSVVGAPRWW
jgi:inositol transport system permease protein